MNKIAVVTATRAEYGILKPLIKRLFDEKEFETQLLVTGTHLLDYYGNTKNEIEKDNIDIYYEIPIFQSKDDKVADVTARALKGFSDYFEKEAPDILIVLGDRTELLGICSAATIHNIPIAHIHGGELTEGAVDDAIRHAVTKMSHLHFPICEEYRKRIIQMGEEPERVFNVGALSTENILKESLLSKEDLCLDIALDKEKPYVMVTYHPVTRDKESPLEKIEVLIEVMKEKSEYQYLITKANADVGGIIINERLQQFANECDNVILVSSLGMKRYLSAVKYSEFVLGNSSSGVIEAPVLGTPTVNIGTRQKGRVMADTVVQATEERTSILDAIEKVKSMSKKSGTFLFGDGKTSGKIVEHIKAFIGNQSDSKKKFYDIDFRE